MENPFSRLIKVMALERKQGYRNKAVIGGLDKFAGRWEADARSTPADPALVTEIVSLLLGYPALDDATVRERIIDQIVKRAAEAGGDVPAAAGPPEPARPTGAGIFEARQARPAPRVPDSPSWPEPPRPGAPAAPPHVAGDEWRVVPSGTRPSPARPADERRDPPASDRPREERPAQDPPAPRRAEERPAPKPGNYASPRPSQPPAAPRTPPEPVAANDPDAPVTRLPSVGPGYAEKLARLRVFTVRDLLYLAPRRYDDYTALRTIGQLQYGEEVTIIGTVWQIDSRVIGEGRKLVRAVVGDGTGEIEMTWFNPFIEKQLRRGQAYIFSGKVDSYRGHPAMRTPEFEPLEGEQIHTARLVPQYPLTEGLGGRWLRKVMKAAVDGWAPGIGDPLPPALIAEHQLMPLAEAVVQLHFPDNWPLLHAAHRRLSFDEFLVLQLAVQEHRQRFRRQDARPLKAGAEVLAPFVDRLPFGLTGAQQRSLDEITRDLEGSQPMGRLLQGDVGSGKTAVAAAALWVAVQNGAQGAIMAPTEILAEQHARTFGRLFDGLQRPDGRPVRIVLLTGRLRKSERDEAVAAMASGDADIAIGTHALIQANVSFDRLAVAVVDEQHRFGVEQRSALRQKGLQPHLLVMSATPIPRSLALSVYGDLDLSVIDEMPAGRTPVRTKWLAPTQRERAYEFIRKQAAAGLQSFVIYPLVENAEWGEAKAAVDEYSRLRQVIFPNLRIGLLHGRLRGDEKDAVMRAFSAGELDVLVATSVVEVGIDVPNATVIMIESAERFGLAQLHQFRGRVGRGEQASYCILVSEATSGPGIQRLQALETNNDGFKLAQIDLEMRGPGDFLGTRQSGLPPLEMAQLSDLRTLEEARAAAQELLARDPGLAMPEHRVLARLVSNFWTRAGDLS